MSVSIHEEGVVHAGVLASGRKWKITESRKKAPGISEGKHYILVLVDDESAIHQIPTADFAELALVAHNFASHRTAPYYNARIAYNFPGVGRRNHVHLHIMIPEGADVLDPLVSRGDAVLPQN